MLATGRARTRSEVAQAALDILCRATGAEAGLVTTADGGYEAAGQIGVSQAAVDVIVDYGELGGPLARALEAPGAYVSGDVATAPIRDDVRAAIAADGIEHLIVVGLRLADRLAASSPWAGGSAPRRSRPARSCSRPPPSSPRRWRMPDS